MKYETINIYRNKMSGQYLVQPMARHPFGASAEFGKPVRISPEEFESRIIPAVLDNLAKYHKQKFDDKLSYKPTDEEYEKFQHNHECVNVLLEETGLFEIVAMTGSMGRAGKIYLRREEAEEKLLPALKEAFRRARGEI